MARKEAQSVIYDDMTGLVGMSAESELLIPEGGIRTRSGVPVKFPSGIDASFSNLTLTPQQFAGGADIGNGSTNATIAIQAALDAAGNYNYLGSKGAEVFLPPGHYSVTNLVIPSHVHLTGRRSGSRGTGQTSPRISAQSGTTGFLIKAADVTNSTGWAIQGLTLYGNNGVAPNLAAIGMRSATDVLIRDMHIESFGKECVVAGSAVSGSAGNPGAQVLKLEHIFAQGCFTPLGARTGVIAITGVDNYFIDVEAAGPNTLNNAGLYACAAYIKSGNSFFSNCVFELADIGLYLDASQNRLSNIRVDLNRGHGLYIDVNGGENLWSGCMFLNNGQETHNTYDNMYVNGADNEFGACFSISSNGGSNLPRYGINDQRPSASFRNTYSGCRSYGTYGTKKINLANDYEASIFAIPQGSTTPFADGDTTPSVDQVGLCIANNTAATLITNFDDGILGQTITVRAVTDNTTIAHDPTKIVTRSGVNIPLSAGETRTFVLYTSVWSEIAPAASSLELTAVSATDSTAALTSVLMATGSRAKKRKHLHGVIRVTSTITYPTSTSGGVVHGDGIQAYYEIGAHEAQAGSHTVLLWDGAAGGTMINGDNQLRTNFDNITFVGRPSAGASNQAAYFWKGVYPPGGASGVQTFQDCSWEAWAGVFLFGEGGTVGAADITLRKCETQNVDTFIETTNLNAINFNLDQLSANNTRRIAYLHPGGSITVKMLNAATCGGTGANDWMFDIQPGLGCGNITFQDIRLEQNSKHFLRADNGNITLKGFDEAQADQDQTMFYLTGGNFHMSDSRIVTHDATNPTFILASGSGGIDGECVLERCHFNTGSSAFLLNEWFKWADGNQRTRLILRDCTYGATKKRLPFFSSSIEHGPLRLFCRTTSLAAHWMSFVGVDQATNYDCIRIPTDSSWLLDFRMVARKSDGSALSAWHRRITVTNVAGTITIGAVQTIGTDFGSYTVPAISAYTSLSSVLLSSPGVASATVDWVAEVSGVGVITELQ